MTSSRIAFVSAIGLAILALFMINGAEAATLNNAVATPNDSRVDGSQEMQFSIDFDDQGEDVGTVAVHVWFAGTDDTYDLTCGECSGGDPDGTYTIIGASLPMASSLVASPGSDTIEYGFIAELSNDDDGAHYPAPDATEDTNIRVNTLPVLTDDAAVAGGGMPEDTYTITVTYTDADGHAGTVSATACDASDNCEDAFSLSTDDSDTTDGAVYSADFTTELGGDITVTVSASDSHDDATDDRTATFTVDTETPWLKNAVVSPTSAGESDDITFTVTYCVFDAENTGTPSVDVSVGAWGSIPLSAGESNADCKNGVDYSTDSGVPWAAAAQAVSFSASNSEASSDALAGDSISINDAPTLTTGTAEKSDTNFVFTASASDVNSDDGDTFKVYVTIEADSEREMTCDGSGDCTLTVAESDIIDQLGGMRSVSFRVADDNWGAEHIDGFSQTIEVTRTSSFGWVAPGDGSFQPGTNDYSFDVTNNGNSEDTFTVTASSDNGWVASGSESQTVTVGRGATETFTITMDVAHVAAGIVDHWSASITAGNDDTQTNSHNGETPVASVSGVSVSIGTSSGSALPGGSVSYLFIITNTGNADEAFAYTTTSDSDWGLGGGAGDTDTLGMGASETITVVHTVSESASFEDLDTITFDVAGGFPDGASRTATTTSEQT